MTISGSRWDAARASRANRASLVSRAASVAMLAFATLATAADATYKLRVPAQNLESALVAFAESTGIQLLYSARLTAGLKSKPLDGDYAPQVALTRLLDGTGLTFRFTDAKTVTISRAADDKSTRVLGPVRVEGAEQQPDRPTRGEGVAQLGGIRGGQDQEARGYRPVVASVGTGAPTAIEDIPRAVSVLTQEQIEKQDINDIGEALRHMPGVSVIEAPPDPNGATIISRGYKLQSVQVDGDVARPLNILGNGLLDIGAYEKIELIRGPNGLYAGDGSPGGSLNLVRKRPGIAESLQLTAIGGSWDRRQLGVDYSTPSVGGSAIAFRGVATYQDREFFYGNSERKNWLLYGIADAPLGDQARLELGYQHGGIDESGSYRGIGRYAEGPLWDVPRDFNFAPPGVYQHVNSNEVFGKFYMDLPANWNFEMGVSYLQQDHTAINEILGATFLQATRAVRPGTTVNASLRAESRRTTNLGADFRIAGRASTFGINHSLYLAGEFNEFSSPGNEERVGSPGKLIKTLADLDPSAFPTNIVYRPFSAQEFHGTSSTRGVVVGDTISWRNWFDLNLSARRSDSNSKFLQINRDNDPTHATFGKVTVFSYSAATSGNVENKPHWEPSWFLTLKPLKRLSVYGSLSNGTQPQDSYFTPAGESLGPLTYENREIGIKYGAYSWLATLAAYDTSRTNVAASIPDTAGQCPPDPESFCFYQQGDSLRSKGVELELTGEIFAGLAVSANYDYNRTKKVPGVQDLGALIFTQAPDRSANLLLDWKPWFAPKTTVTLGASYRSSIYQAGTRRFFDPVTGKVIPPTIPFEFTEPSHVVIDAGFGHDFPNNLAFNLLVENLTNKSYLSTVSTGTNFVGTPRSITATLRWKPYGEKPSNSISPTTGLAPFGDPGNWYGSFELGSHDAGTLSAKSDGLKLDGTRAAWDFETKPDTVSFVRLGYRLTSHWRVEGEGGFRATSFGRISGGGAAPDGVCDASGSSNDRPFNCENAPGEADAWSLMVNGLYDFRAESARIRPFVGLGLGLARWSIDFGGKMKGVGLDTPWGFDPRYTTESIAGDDATLTWAWQATTGISVRLTDRAHVTAAYTYYNAPRLRWDSYNMPTLTPTLGTFRANYKEQALTVGIQWFFGQRSE